MHVFTGITAGSRLNGLANALQRPLGKTLIASVMKSPASSPKYYGHVSELHRSHYTIMNGWAAWARIRRGRPASSPRGVIQITAARG